MIASEPQLLRTLEALASDPGRAVRPWVLAYDPESLLAALRCAAARLRARMGPPWMSRKLRRQPQDDCFELGPPRDVPIELQLLYLTLLL
jgi:hypothetical protein